MTSLHHGGSTYGYQTSNMSGTSRSASYQRPPLGGHAQRPAAAEAFTAEMRDRQARGKDPYQDSEDSDANHRASNSLSPDAEPHTVVEKRREAAQVLDNPELLMVNAQRDNDSMPATRLRYTRMLCGIKEPEPPADQRHSSSSRAAAAAAAAASSHHHGSKRRTKTPSKRHSSGVGRDHNG